MQQEHSVSKNNEDRELKLSIYDHYMDAVSISIYMKDEEYTWEKYICLIVIATMRTKS